MREVLRLETPDYVLEWTTLVQGHKRLLVEAARDHGKSFTFSYSYPLWLVQKTHDPDQAFGIIFVSYAETQAAKNLKRVRKAVEEDPFLQWLLPKSKSSVWDVSTLDFSNGCWIESYGFGSALRGRHPRIAIVDDPCKDHGTMSVEEQIQFFSGVITPATGPRGQIIVTGNPVDQKDFLEWLEGNKAFSRHKYPILNDRGEPLWPDRYDMKAIERVRAETVPHIFAREYLLKRVSSAEAKFKEEWIKYYEAGTVPVQGLYRVMTIDPVPPAMPGQPVGDALAAVVTGTDGSMNSYILDYVHTREDTNTGLELICDMIERTDPDIVGVEDFAFQVAYKIWLQEAMDRRGLKNPLVGIGKNSRPRKSARIEALQPKIIQGKLLFRRELDRDTVDQLILWNPTSKHNDDDLIDALAWQVPIWDNPFEDSDRPAERPKAGTFEEAMQEIRASKMNSNYITRLFSDMVGEA